jgi:3-oxoacyl-[acyl-carrier protein] reductase
MMLAGRRALVTGGSGGIGRAIATHLAAAGATVVIADRDAAVHDALADTAAVAALDFDATDEAEVTRAVAQAEDILGGVDVLVAAHGILTQNSTHTMTLAMWNETLAVDLTSFFLLNRAVLPGMLDRRDGRIINVASQLGIKGGVELAHYCAAKAGVIAMTKSLALEYSAHNVLSNVIAPGPIETPLFHRLDDEWKRAKQAELPLRRVGIPDEVAPTAVLLASNPGGNLYTGQVLGPNSGDVMP